MMGPTPEVVAALYDEKADEYDEHYLRRTDLAENRVLYGWLAPLVNDRVVLDVGCGTGLLLDYCTPVIYTGVDPSARMLGRARARRVSAQEKGTGAITFREQTAEQVQRERKFYDVALSLWAFPHFRDQEAALRNMLSAVRPGGRLVIQGFRPRYARRPNYILNGHGEDLLVPTSAADLRSMATAAGWTDVSVKGFRFLLDGHADRVLGVAPLAAMMRAGSATLPADWAATQILTATRPA